MGCIWCLFQISVYCPCWLEVLTCKPVGAGLALVPTRHPHLCADTSPNSKILLPLPPPPTGPHLGATLMHPLAITFDGSESPTGHGHAARPGLRQRGLAEIQARERLLAAIRRFRERVARELGDVYYWFDDASLHITIRALIN
jgi:hypothetical protein